MNFSDKSLRRAVSQHYLETYFISGHKRIYDHILLPGMGSRSLIGSKTEAWDSHGKGNVAVTGSVFFFTCGKEKIIEGNFLRGRVKYL